MLGIVPKNCGAPDYEVVEPPFETHDHNQLLNWPELYSKPGISVANFTAGGPVQYLTRQAVHV
jgi:hypothetical protein